MQVCAALLKALPCSPPLQVGMQGALLKALQADLVAFMGAVGGPGANGVAAAAAASLPIDGFTSTMTRK